MDKIRAVVFDCDGVMFDTADVNRLYYNRLLDHFKKPSLTEEQFVNVHMLSVKGAIGYLFPDEENLDDVFDYMKKLKYSEFIEHMAIEPGLVALLDGLKKNGYVRAVATNRTDTMQAVLKAFELVNRFESVVTAADVDNPKPAPDQLLKIMEQFSLKPREILFIGDSEFDEKAALGAGTVFAAFKNSSLTADFYFTEMAQIGVMLNMNL